MWTEMTLTFLLLYTTVGNKNIFKIFTKIRLCFYAVLLSPGIILLLGVWFRDFSPLYYLRDNNDNNNEYENDNYAASNGDRKEYF